MVAKGHNLKPSIGDADDQTRRHPSAEFDLMAKKSLKMGHDLSGQPAPVDLGNLPPSRRAFEPGLISADGGGPAELRQSLGATQMKTFIKSGEHIAKMNNRSTIKVGNQIVSS